MVLVLYALVSSLNHLRQIARALTETVLTHFSDFTVQLKIVVSLEWATVLNSRLKLELVLNLNQR